MCENANSLYSIQFFQSEVEVPDNTFGPKSSLAEDKPLSLTPVQTVTTSPENIE
jgi:hypothetical protein